MKSLWRVALLAAVLVLQACEFGSSPGGGTGAEGLTGMIVDGAGAPVAGARVRVYPTAAPLPKAGKASIALRMAAASAAKTDSTFTDAKGRYRFKKLPKGTYNLEASARSHDTAYALFIPGVALTRSRDLGVDTLRAAGAVRVRARDSDGAFLPGALCSIPGSSWSAVADGEGICRIEGVAPGTYTVRVSASGRAGETALVTVESGRESDAGDAVLGSGLNGPWITASLKGYAYDIPEGLELTAGGQDSGGFQFAWYFGPPLHLSAGLEMVNVTGLDTMPNYTESPFFDDGTVRATLASYLDIHIAGEYRDTTHGLLLKLVDRATQQPRLNFVLQFRGEDLRPLAMRIVRSVRKWSGPGKAPGSPPMLPTLHSVHDSAVEVPLSPDFQWVPSGTADFFHLQVSRTPDFAQLVFEDSLIPGASQSRTVSGLRENTRYHWKIGSRKATFKTAWSQTQTFTTGTSRSGYTSRIISGENALNDVVWNGALWVAVGEYGTILTSPDGSSWTSRNSGTTETLKSVVWTGTRFVAVGWGVFLTSSNGSGWTLQTVVGNFNDVVWTGSQLVAVGDSGRIRTSSDGLAWADRSRPFKNLLSISWSGSALLAVSDGDSAYGSEDAVTWTPRALPWYAAAAVTWHGDRWVSVGSQAGVSSDGITWETHRLPGSSHFVARVEDGLLAGGYSGRLYRSTDGETWQPLYTGLFQHPLNAAASDGVRQVVVGGAYQALILTSK